MLFVGLSLMLYPTISDQWNGYHQTRVIAEYNREVEKLDEAGYDALWEEAKSYNRALLQKTDRYHLTDQEREEYESLLNLSGTGAMGYIEIPRIQCSLPFYHGTDEAVLQKAIGHIEGSSLPVGGESTHCVLSGHRGLPSARLFTDLDVLCEGDIFLLRVLDQTLTYEVDQIRIVEPDQLSALGIEEGEDYCTLVTCTPYGVNSHRLLVRGHRIENGDEGTAYVSSDAAQIDPVLVMPMVAVPILLVLMILLLPKRKRRK